MEYLSYLSASVCYLLADIELVVFVALCTARGGGLTCESAHIVIGIVCSAAKGSRKSCYVAERVIGCSACIISCIKHCSVLSAEVIRENKKTPRSLPSAEKFVIFVSRNTQNLPLCFCQLYYLFSLTLP